mmetsp:Transcript_13131/g.14753  ORF Transcript_13131/g.14753 Transcript_13131/m.14753 type:complete len:107 (-) Transcript_13131:49-369(-)
MNGINLPLLIPTHFIGWIDSIFTLINKYALWVNYCNFGSIFSIMDRFINTPEMPTMVLLRFLTNFNNLRTQIGEISKYFSKGDCFFMFIPVGEIFSVLFGFIVPQR